MNAQREALKKAGKEGSLAEMVGDPANRTHFRQVLTVLVGAAVEAGDAVVKLRCLVPPGHASLTALDAALTGGAALISKQEGWKSTLPKFESKGDGLPEFSAGGHDPGLLAAAQERVAKLLPAK